MSLRSSDYLVTPQPVDNPRARLVVFPHAGGGPSSFASWQEGLKGERVEVVVISAPGRERRVAEAAHTSCEALVAEVAEALQASGLVDDVPYAFFGHSLGSLVALETARPLASEITASVIGGSCHLSSSP
jgi:surfactin synthase thioesterase subunit